VAAALAFSALGISQAMAATSPDSTEKRPGYESVSRDIARYQAMQDIMKQMQSEMTQMTEQMGKSDLTAEARKDLAAKFKEMAAVMTRMAGLQDRPSMTAAESQKQLDSMRRSMARMTADHRASTK